jgi:SAM-dependent methyltransferase
MTDPSLVDRLVRNEADMAFRRRVRTIFEWLDPQDGDTILDAGSGRGFYLRFLREACDARLAGLELEHDYLRIARAALGPPDDITLASGSLYAPPFPDAAFDKIILSEVLEHVPDDVEALRALKRVLKPGGLIAITVPNANYPFWWDPINRSLEAVLQTHIQRGVLAGIWANHLRLYTREELRRAVIEAGLEVVDERSFTHHAFPFIHNIVYGFGKTALEAGMLPAGVAQAANRHDVTGQRGSALNPVNVGLWLFEWFDRKNVMDEPPGRATVNLCILARKQT